MYSGNLKRDLLYVTVRGINVTIDGVPYTLGNSWGLHSQFLLFGCVSYGSSISAAGTVTLQACKIGSCKLYLNNVLVRDFIPVRVGTVGYMYDRVTRRLFGNSGTGGAFVLGPDKAVPILSLNRYGASRFGKIGAYPTLTPQGGTP